MVIVVVIVVVTLVVVITTSVVVKPDKCWSVDYYILHDKILEITTLMSKTTAIIISNNLNLPWIWGELPLNRSLVIIEAVVIGPVDASTSATPWRILINDCK